MSTTAPRRRVVVRTGTWSIRVPVRAVVVVVLLVVGAFGLVVLATGAGKYPVAPADVLGVFTGANTGFDRVVVLEWRLPRAVMAVLVGAALGMSGAIFQALTRNPLGSPDIIGLNVGAYTGALVAIVAFGGGYYPTAAGALVGGLLSSAVVFLLSLRNGSLSGFRLIIIGIAVSALLYSVNDWFVIKVDLRTAASASVWQQGDISGASWAQTVPMAVCLAVAVAVLLVLGQRLQILQLGDDAAGGLGVDTARTRIRYFLVGVALVAVAAAAAGPISFVALAAPQLGRMLTGSAGVGLAPSAAMGGFLLLASDVAAQRVLPPHQLPIGSVTVVFGGGYLIWLLLIQSRRV